jgi:AcrR family transcriptional regulator
MTIFNYFPTKEDLVIRPMEDHVGDPARCVRDRRPQESAVAALRRDFLAALDRRDATTGLNDTAGIVGVQRLALETPSLTHRVYALGHRAQQLLADELAGHPGWTTVLAAAAAAQIIGARQALIDENVRRILNKESADAIRNDAVTNAEQVFALLESGLPN